MRVKVVTKLDKLQKQLKNIDKKSLRVGVKLIVVALRATAPKETGALRKSFTSKVDSPRGSMSAYGIAGPKSKFIMALAGKKPRHPSRYAAPLEKSPNGKPFLMPAWRGNRAAYIAAVRDKYAEETLKVLNG
jgi:hypothetical protein